MKCEIQSTPRLGFKEVSVLDKSLRGLGKGIEIYSKIIQTLPFLLWLKDLDGLYLACNQRFEEFLGASESEILGKTDHDLVNSRSAALLQEHDEELIRTGSPSVSEEWVTFSNDGHRELLEISRLPMYGDHGELIGLLGMARRVTTRKESDEKLRESEERFSLAMRGANDGLWDWNLETNQVYYSPRWKSMLGYQDDELDDDLSTWQSLVHPDDREIVLNMVQDCLLGNVDSFDVEMRMQHKAGHEIFVRSRAGTGLLSR